MEKQTNIQGTSANDIAQKLKSRATESPAFNALCYVFAMRERTRQQLTLSHWVIYMHREGYTFEKKEYEDAFKFLASIGIGELDYDSKGKLRALKNIKITLQSIGKAAISKEPSTFENFKPKTSFKNLVVPKASTDVRPVIREKIQQVMAPKPVDKPAKTLTINLAGESFDFELPQDVSAKDLLGIVSELYSKGKLGNRRGNQ